MAIRTRLTGLALTAALAAGGPATAATVVGATHLEITSAASDYIQIAEVQAFEFGSGDNVASAAEGGTASATSAGFGGSPEGAIDGNDSPFYGSHFYHARTGNPDEKLFISLGRMSTLSSLRIVGRADCCRGRDAWNVSIFDSSNNVLFSGLLDSRSSATFDAVVNFDAPATGAVPEPGAWALMIAGFGLAGAALRRRRETPLVLG